MFCTKCGARIVDSGRFCGQCGSPVVSVQKSTAFTAPAARPRKRRKKWPAVILALLILALAALVPAAWVYRADRTPSEQTTAPIVPIEQTEPDAPEQPETPPVQTPEPVEPAVTAADADEIIDSFALRYYLNELDEPLLANFCAMYQSAMAFEPWCVLPYEMTADDLSALLLLLNLECPELLQLDTGAQSSYLKDAQTGSILEVELQYRLTQEEYRQQYALCMEAIGEIVRAAEGLSDYEKELLAYERIVRSCSYDADGVEAATAYGVFGVGYAKCDGISLAMKWAMEQMGIPCLVVVGEDPYGPVGHAWNIVCIDGRYYDLDLTADIGTSDSPAQLMYFAFNVSDQWIREDYVIPASITDRIELPGTPDMEGSYYARNGLYLREGAPYEPLIESLLPALWETGGDVCFQFESAAEFARFVAEYETYVPTLMAQMQMTDCLMQVYYEEVNRIVCLELVFG